MTLQAFLGLGLLLFALGLYTVLLRQHLIGVLVGIELMLNAASLNMLAFGRFGSPSPGTAQVFVLFIIGLAAAEAAIALSIIVVVFRSQRSADIGSLGKLKG